jgi:6-phosphogluconolactonase (cycloisomerase 2 family)
MGIKFSCFRAFLVLIASVVMTACSNTNSSSTIAGTGVLYVTTQGNSSVTAFGINLSTGAVSATGTAVATGSVPSAVVVDPSGKTVFVANSNSATTPAAGTISSYKVNSDGTLTAAGGTQNAGTEPMGMAIDAAGKFLFVANRGVFSDPTSGAVSVFSISGTTLTPVGLFPTEDANATSGSGPVAVAISPNGQYLYAANQFTNTVKAFSVGSNGALTALGSAPQPATYNAGTAPSAVVLTPDGNFLYVANQGSNNVTAFAACTNASLSCSTPNGLLAPVAGSPFAAGLGPISVAAAADSKGEYLFVADYASNQLSQYKVGVGSGALTAQSPPDISTGTNPVSVTVRAGNGAVLGTGGTTNYVYVANLTSGTISSYSYDTTTGLLAVVGQAVTTAGQPSAVAAK